ncbi:MAG: NAD(P)/FAD-dependent oxidoreductase [Pseudomonadota bacterium]
MAAVPERDYDLMIVGASFAGAACAIAAAQYGLRVCVLERKRDPGLKLHTTGIIVKEAAERTWLNRVPAHLVRKVDRVRLYAPNLRNVALQVPDYYFLTTDTPNLMRWLADEMRDQGVDLRLAQPFTQASRETSTQRGRWHLPGIGRTHWLVGADGAKSRVAQRFGMGGVRHFLYGMEYEFAGLELREPDALHCFVNKALAPGYIGWATQSPTGVQFGLAFRHRPSRTGTPDIDAMRALVGHRIGIPDDLTPSAIRAGLIPCGGPVAPLARPGVILTGDAAGIVSPVTAGGIHSAWQHGWTVGEAVARHLRDGGPPPEGIAERAAPRYRIKRALRWAFDHAQMGSAPMRWAAERVYFHRSSGGTA